MIQKIQKIGFLLMTRIIRKKGSFNNRLFLFINILFKALVLIKLLTKSMKAYQF